MKRVTPFAAVTVALALAGTAVAQSPAPTRIRGDIVSATGDTLVVHRQRGDTLTLSLAPKAQVSAVRKIAISEIKAGSFIGTAATDANGNLTAQEVVVFPESERGTGEGHYAWDLGPKSTMTNGNVDAVVKSTDGQHLRLSFKGGSNTVTVPPNVPIVTFVAATRADLVAGKKVFVIATEGADKHLVAQRVVVEKDGVAPPM
ncbi:MAG TPA: hypothetical protein VGO53_10810 [Steroidobacteraceae bacterium]|jgi:hypothetical protein|nr:hypothetical protein [Steroidobacteraceae bacterium]